MIRKSLAVGIVFLFIVSSVGSIGKVSREERIEPLDGPMDSAWPMKCHDLHHTGRSPIGTADISYNELWKFEFDGSSENSPAIGSDGVIYVGGSYGDLTRYLFAIYPNGTLKWRYFADGLISISHP